MKFSFCCLLKLIPALVTVLLAVPCTAIAQEDSGLADDHPEIRTVDSRFGTIEGTDLRESSGVIASRQHPGIYWTHNDSGNAAELFAITKNGKIIRKYRVEAANRDWEDISADEKFLYVADIGNNARSTNGISVLQIEEPDPFDESGDKVLLVSRQWNLHYSEEPFDSEALCVLGNTGYLITKNNFGGAATVHQFDLQKDSVPQVLEKVCTLPVFSPVTGADIDPGGKWLACITPVGLHLFQIEGKVRHAETVVPKKYSFFYPSIEGCTIIPEGVFATSENNELYLFTWQAINDGRERLPETSTFAIRRAVPEPAVDGDFDDWDLPQSQLPLNSSKDDLADGHTARLWTSWNTNGLFFMIVVPDPQLEPLRKLWYTGDVVEIFLGRDAGERSPEYHYGDDRCYVGFETNSAGTDLQPVIHWPRHRDRPPEGCKVAGRPTENHGYQLELFIPFSVLSPQAKNPISWAAGDTLRCNVTISSRTPRRNWHLSESNQNGTFLSPVTWAVLKLVK